MDKVIVDKAQELIDVCRAYEDKYRAVERLDEAFAVTELRMAVEASLLTQARVSGGTIEAVPEPIIGVDGPETFSPSSGNFTPVADTPADASIQKPGKGRRRLA